MIEIKDCDGNELEEFTIIRTPFYADINFEEDPNIEARQYAVVEVDNEPYLVSVYDWWNKKVINIQEGREQLSDVPRKVLPGRMSENYETAYSSEQDIFKLDNDIMQEECKQLVKRYIRKSGK